MFPRPVLLESGKWYDVTVCMREGKYAHGLRGRMTSSIEDVTVFAFRTSQKSHKDTDVNKGQIPQLLYRLL